MVKHILKDGTVLKTIEGYVVRKEVIPEIYELIKRKEKKYGNQV